MPLIGGALLVGATIILLGVNFVLLRLLPLAVYTLLALLMSMTHDVAALESIKGALGSFLFLSTLTLAPYLLRRRIKLGPFFRLLLIFHLVAFYAAFSGLLDFRAIGVVAYFGISDATTYTDPRLAGVFGEVSWFAIAVFVLGWYIREAYLLPFWAELLCFGTLLLLDSGIGLVCAALSAAHFGICLHRRRVRGPLAKFGIIVCSALILGASVFGILLYGTEESITKIFDPLAVASGQARFLSPLPIVSSVFQLDPLFGRGYAYITENLFGVIAAATVPLNVFIELGLVGVLIYTLTFVFAARIGHSNALGIGAAIVILLSLGLHYSPFEALSLALLLSRSALSDKSSALELYPKEATSIEGEGLGMGSSAQSAQAADVFSVSAATGKRMCANANNT